MGRAVEARWGSMCAETGSRTTSTQRARSSLGVGSGGAASGDTVWGKSRQQPEHKTQRWTGMWRKIITLRPDTILKSLHILFNYHHTIGR